MNWPTVSFAIATLNSSRTLENCLKSIRDQDYPAKIEIVIADGGSSDGTLNIARKYKSRIFHVPKNKQNAEYNKGIAVLNSKLQLLALIDHDNILPHRHWLKNMVLPMVENKSLLGCAVLRFQWDRKMALLDRYFALIGGTDPVPVFFNKSAHQSWAYDGFHLRGGLTKEFNKYYLVNFDPEFLPALGGNGAIIKRSLLKKAKSDPKQFFHIDVHVDLAEMGFTKYAFVKETIRHLTYSDIFTFLGRKKHFIEKYHFIDKSQRRYSIYEPTKDRLKLIMFVIYSLTLIGPILFAFRGYLKIRDVAWFLHPIICFSFMVVYGYPTIKEGLKNALAG